MIIPFQNGKSLRFNNVITKEENSSNKDQTKWDNEDVPLIEIRVR